MDRLEAIRKKILEKQPVIGASVCFADASVTDLMCHAGYDLIWIDMEHGPLDRREVLHHIMAANGAGKAAFVRVPWNDPVLVKPILDMGPDGIVFPFIRTAEEARLAVSSCEYPPRGIRGFAPMRSIRYHFMDLQEYLIGAGAEIWKIIQIEHLDAVRNLDAILAVDGIDTIVVGSMDLSGSVGLLGQTNHPKVRALLDEIARKVTQAGIPLGIATGSNPQTIQEWIDRGISWMTIGRDFDFLTAEAGNALKRIRALYDG
jgi:2-dehydro-3-deoxyglucarate aldolase/4-hydroxy-2-oxoheptanedioate aldolase